MTNKEVILDGEVVLGFLQVVLLIFGVIAFRRASRNKSFRV